MFENFALSYAHFFMQIIFMITCTVYFEVVDFSWSKQINKKMVLLIYESGSYDYVNIWKGKNNWKSKAEKWFATHVHWICRKKNGAQHFFHATFWATPFQCFHLYMELLFLIEFNSNSFDYQRSGHSIWHALSSRTNINEQQLEIVTTSVMFPENCLLLLCDCTSFRIIHNFLSCK